jgi:hypothetical protein
MQNVKEAAEDAQDIQDMLDFINSTEKSDTSGHRHGWFTNTSDVPDLLTDDNHDDDGDDDVETFLLECDTR